MKYVCIIYKKSILVIQFLETKVQYLSKLYTYGKLAVEQAYLVPFSMFYTTRMSFLFMNDVGPQIFTL